MYRTLALLIVAGLVASSAAAAASTADPTAITGTVSSVGSTSVTVGGTINPGGEATTWYVEYGTSTSYGAKTPTESLGAGASNVAVSTAITGLAPGTTHHYRLVAENQDGVSRGSDGVFQTTTAPAPDVSTRSASEIGPGKARFNGRVDPNGLTTTWYFEYGTSTGYGTRTAEQSAGSGTSRVSVSTLVTGLRSGVTYHYRIVAANDAGAARGGDVAFRTDPPPSVSTGSVSSVGSSSAKLNGSVNPRGRATTAWFEYGTTSSLGARTEGVRLDGSSSRAVSATIASLQPGTRIYYRVVAQSDAGTVAGSTRSFTTRAGPGVSTVTVTEIAATGAAVAGSVNPNGRSTIWWFEYGPSTGYGAQTSRQSAGSGTSAVGVKDRLGGLPPNSEVHARLVAESSGGRTYGADVSFRTLGVPLAVTGQVTALRTSSATVGGSVTPNGLETTWWVEYGPSSSLGSRTAPQSAGVGTTAVPVSVALVGLTSGVRYSFRVVAQNSAGTATGGVASFATVPPPRDERGRPVSCTIFGTVGPDVLRGTPGADVICGLGGDDRIAAGGGNDLVLGGPGNDRLDGGAGSDVLIGGVGNDQLSGGSGSDELWGNSGSDGLFGGSGNDELHGGDGDDTLIGGRGGDMVLGEGGRDVLYVRDGARDIARGGPGRDRVLADRKLDRVS